MKISFTGWYRQPIKYKYSFFDEMKKKKSAIKNLYNGRTGVRLSKKWFYFIEKLKQKYFAAHNEILSWKNFLYYPQKILLSPCLVYTYQTNFFLLRANMTHKRSYCFCYWFISRNPFLQRTKLQWQGKV